METSRRPLENGTVNHQNKTKSGNQGGVQRPSRAPIQGGTRAPLRRPSEVQRRQNVANKDAATKNTASNVTEVQSRTIPKMAEEYSSEMTLGTPPEVRDVEKKSVKKGWIPTKNSRIKEPMPLATIVFSILCTVLVMFMMINFVKINEYTRENAELQNKLDQLNRTEQELAVELEKKNELIGIDFEKLGLVKEDNLQKVEIIAEKDETAEHFEVEEQDNGMLATVMNALYRNFKEYRNIFLGSE